MQNRLTILHLITTLHIGGAEMMLLKLLTYMNPDSFSNRVICLTKPGRVGEEMKKRGIALETLDMPLGRLTTTGVFKLWRLFRFETPMILQTWLYHSDLLGLIFGRLTGIEHIVWNIRCSNMDMGNYRVFSRWVLKLCTAFSRFPDAILSNSVRGREYHGTIGYKARRWEVIPNGVSLEEFSPDDEGKARLLAEMGNAGAHISGDGTGEYMMRVLKEPIVIGLVARYDAKKDHPSFVKAGCILLQKRKDVHFVMVGRNVTWDNLALASQIPRDKRDHFHLFGERQDVSSIVAGLDIACLSSSYGEGFPNIVAEAMACGVPCVVTDVGDSAKIVGETGRVVPPRDPQSLAMACLSLIDLGQERRRGLGKAARDRIKEHFDLSHVVGRYESFYRSLVGPG